MGEFTPKRIVDFEILLVNSGINVYDLVNFSRGGITGNFFNSYLSRLSNVNFPVPGTIQIRPYLDKLHNTALLPTGIAPFLVAYEPDLNSYGAVPTPAPTALVYSCDVSPDGHELAVGFNDNASGLYTYTIASMERSGLPPVMPGAASVKVCYSPNGKWLAAVHVNAPYVTVYDRLNAMAKITLPLPTAPQYGCDFSSDGAYFATCGASANSFNLYRTSDWTKVTTTAQTINIFDVKFSPNGSKVGVVSGELGPMTSPKALGYYDIVGGTFNWPDMNMSANEKYWGPPGIFMLHWLDEVTTLFVGMRSKTPSLPTTVLIWDWDWQMVRGVFSTSLGDCWGGAVVKATATRLIQGTVKNAVGDPLWRTVLAYDRDSGKIVGEAMSGGGAFTLKVYTADPVIVIARGEDAEICELYDSVAPEIP